MALSPFPQTGRGTQSRLVTVSFLTSGSADEPHPSPAGPDVTFWGLPPHAKSWLIGKDPDAGRDWGQEEKGTTEDEMAGWHHWLDGHESEWTPGVGDGQGGLVCCHSWGLKESDTTEWLNWSESNIESAPHPISHVHCPQDLIFHKKLFYCFYDDNS